MTQKEKEKEKRNILVSIEDIKNKNEQYLTRYCELRDSYEKLPWYVRLLKFLSPFRNKILVWSFSTIKDKELKFLKRGMGIEEIENIYHEMISKNYLERKQLIENKEKIIEEISDLNKKISNISEKLLDLKLETSNFTKYKFGVEDIDWDKFDVSELNNLLDKVRYAEFWLAVHYYESKWLSEENPITDKQKGKTFENVLNNMYHRLAMISPCMVMTFFMMPKQFYAYNGNDKKHYHMYNFIDLLIVDEAGQISPEIAAPSFSLAKKAIVVGDEKQIPPVWGTVKALDIAMSKEKGVIQNKEQYMELEQNGLNCSQSSIMKIAGLSCAFDKLDNHQGLFLSEHRRCYDEIVAYCNKLVYKQDLEPKRGSFFEDKENVLNGLLPAMGHKQITVSKSQKSGTSRRNEEEAMQIVKWLDIHYAMILSCYANRNEGMINPTEIVGIITPFKSQSALIKKMLKKEVPEYAGNIDVGTVHTFQGAERKVIIFSSVYGHEGGCFFINQSKNLMNVAVSRAKDSFLVFGDSGCLVGDKKTAAGLLKEMTKTIVK